jgi:hypothetical protein
MCPVDFRDTGVLFGKRRDDPNEQLSIHPVFRLPTFHGVALDLSSGTRFHTS